MRLETSFLALPGDSQCTKRPCSPSLEKSGAGGERAPFWSSLWRPTRPRRRVEVLLGAPCQPGSFGPARSPSARGNPNERGRAAGRRDGRLRSKRSAVPSVVQAVAETSARAAWARLGSRADRAGHTPRRLEGHQGGMDWPSPGRFEAGTSGAGPDGPPKSPMFLRPALRRGATLLRHGKLVQGVPITPYCDDCTWPLANGWRCRARARPPARPSEGVIIATSSPPPPGGDPGRQAGAKGDRLRRGQGD